MIKKYVTCTPNGCSGHLAMPKSAIGKTFEVKEVKPLEDIKLVLEACKHDPKAYEKARKLLMGE